MKIKLKARGCGERQVPTMKTIVLIHGLNRTSISLWILKKRFNWDGYTTICFDYNASKNTLDEITHQFIQFIKDSKETTNCDFYIIGHSLGNIITRNMFKYVDFKALKGIIMLTPPNKPAALAKLMKNNYLFQCITGDCGDKLGNDEFYSKLPIPSIKFGIIAGNKIHEKFGDGIISIESTKLKGATDWIMLNHLHNTIMNCKDTYDCCINFIKKNKF